MNDHSVWLGYTWNAKAKNRTVAVCSRLIHSLSLPSLPLRVLCLFYHVEQTRCNDPHCHGLTTGWCCPLLPDVSYTALLTFYLHLSCLHHERLFT